MKPYDGIEAWIYVSIVVFALLAVLALVFAFRVEKTEKAEEDPHIAGSFRKRKYLLFAGFVVAIAMGSVLGFMAKPISLNAHNEAVVDHIESYDLTVTNGFVDPTIPLVAGKQAKFVVMSDSGLIRCRANAEDAEKNIQFVCQDINSDDLSFTVPLDEVNELENQPEQQENSEDNTDTGDNATTAPEKDTNSKPSQK